jgi:hypothetical protein
MSPFNYLVRYGEVNILKQKLTDEDIDDAWAQGARIFKMEGRDLQQRRIDGEWTKAAPNHEILEGFSLADMRYDLNEREVLIKDGKLKQNKRGDWVRI